MWNDIVVLEKWAKWSPYVLMIIGFLITGGGAVLKDVLQNRISTLKAVAEVNHKNEAPKIDAWLTFSPPNNVNIYWRFLNDIPAQIKWSVLTKDRSAVGGM